MENYLNREKEGGRFSFESILNEELRLDRDEEGGQQGRKNKGATRNRLAERKFMAKMHSIFKGLGILSGLILVLFVLVFFYAYLTGGDSKALSFLASDGVGVCRSKARSMIPGA